MPPREEILAALRARDAFLILGAGVSVATTRGARAASWHGLVEESVNYLAERGVRKEILESIKGDLALADAGSSFLVSALSKVNSQLGGSNSVEYAEWLEKTIGALSVEDSELIDAIVGLDTPILTLNLDTLVEIHTGRAAVVPSEPLALRRSLRANEKSVFHVHGVWTQPETSILTAFDYGAFIGGSKTLELLKAVLQVRTAIFVGVGSAISDPTFEAIFKAVEEVFTEKATLHYRLATHGDANSSSQAAGVATVSYGESHADLVPFLRALATEAFPSGGADWVDISNALYEVLAEDVREAAILKAHFLDIGDRAPQDLLVPPVLLPMPPDSFAAARRAESGPKPERFDARTEARSQSLVLLVGESQSGVTSALRWLVAERHSADPLAAPMVLDYQSLDSSSAQVDHGVRKHVRVAGHNLGKDGKLPRLALAVDGMHNDKPKKAVAAIAELVRLSAELTVVSCRPGEEEDLLRLYRAEGLDPALRYLGHLSRQDVTSIAHMVAPTRVADLVAGALDVVNREHLQRTPLTICLLISIVEAGENLTGLSSTTSLLAQYVDRVLGLGDVDDDGRNHLDAVNRSEILSNLAELYVRERKGSLGEGTVVEFLSRVLEDYSWSDNATSVLADLGSRNVLTLRNQQVSFTQSSFLHFFAARRAIVDEEFRRLMLSDVTTYASAVKHFAALDRRSEAVLEAVAALVELARDDGLGRGRSFDSSREVESYSDADIDSLLDEADPDPVAEGEAERTAFTDDLDWLDVRDVAEPFPAMELETLPAFARAAIVAEISSAVLRDSDLVRNSDVKTRLLSETLGMWAQFVVALETDDEFGESVREAIAEALKASGEEFRENAEAAERFAEQWALMSATAGMAYSLQSQKLSRSLDRCFLNVAFTQDPGRSIMGGILAMLNGGPGWARHLRKVNENHANAPAVAAMFWFFGQVAWRVQSLDRDDESELLRFLTDQTMLRIPGGRGRDKAALKPQIESRLRRERLLSRRLRLGAGETIFSELEGVDPA